MKTLSILKVLSIILLLTLSGEILGQDYKTEVNLLGTISALGDGQSGGSFFEATVRARYLIKPKIGIGIFYSRSMSGTVNFNEYYYLRAEPKYQHYGVEAQASSDRTKRFSIYGAVGLLKAEWVHHYSDGNFYDFKSAKSGLGYTAGFGIAIKITRALSFNLIDCRGILYNKNFSYTEGSVPFGLSVDTGFIYKFIRQR
jgi:opacity protein-like surface antigen